MQHYAIFLESFNYDIKVKTSKDNGNADAMSRLIMENYDGIEDLDVLEKNTSDNIVENINVVELELLENLPVTAAELSKATEADEETKTLRGCLKVGRQCDRAERFNIEQIDFGLQEGCLMRGIRAK